MMRKWYAGLTCSLALAIAGEATAASSEVPVAPTASGSGDDQILVPYLEEAPMIDGDLADWKGRAFTDGVWDIHRVRYSSWFDPEINRLTDHGDEPVPEDDLQARYYIAWDERHLYLGVEARDNVNDVHDPEHADSRWYFKDAVAWFIEAPQDEKSEWFAQGDNSFGFVIDASKPSYGAWWRHGTPSEREIEEPIPADAADYEVRMNPWGRSDGDFILEARVDMAATLGVSDPDWTPPKVGDTYGIEILHTDPDGGAYGGHLLIYGSGGDDADWGEMMLVGPLGPVERREE